MENQSVIQKGRFKCYICPANEHSNGRVIAVTTYKGRTVRGVAVCSLDDTFDEDYGCELAIARCECKIADIRVTLRENEYYKARDAFTDAKFKMDEALSFYTRALDDNSSAKEIYDYILHK